MSYKRETMIKPRVGCVKTTTRDIPEIVHGMKNPTGFEGAGESKLILDVINLMLL